MYLPDCLFLRWTDYKGGGVDKGKVREKMGGKFISIREAAKKVLLLMDGPLRGGGDDLFFHTKSQIFVQF